MYKWIYRISHSFFSRNHFPSKKKLVKWLRNSTSSIILSPRTSLVDIIYVPLSLIWLKSHVLQLGHIILVTDDATCNSNNVFFLFWWKKHHIKLNEFVTILNMLSFTIIRGGKNPSYIIRHIWCPTHFGYRICRLVKISFAVLNVHLR